MSKPLLQRLFDGEVYPSEDIVLHEPKDKELDKKICEELEYFQSILAPEDLIRFEKLNDMQSDIMNTYHYAYFNCGFRLAVGLIIEALTDGEITLKAG
jgi:hypothetical protein